MGKKNELLEQIVTDIKKGLTNKQLIAKGYSYNMRKKAEAIVAADKARTPISVYDNGSKVYLDGTPILIPGTVTKYATPKNDNIRYVFKTKIGGRIFYGFVTNDKQQHLRSSLASITSMLFETNADCKRFSEGW